MVCQEVDFDRVLIVRIGSAEYYFAPDPDQPGEKWLRLSEMPAGVRIQVDVDPRVTWEPCWED